MSFLVKSPVLPQGGASADPKFNSSNKEARRVPMGWGRHPYPSNWISDKYDVHTQSAGSNKPEWQYCSIAAKYCHGPIDYVGKLFADGKEIVNFDYTFADGEEAHTFTINPSLASGRAWQLVLHRGTADAPESGVANLRAKTGQHHPPQRGYCWGEWLNIDQGQGNTALPALTLELGTHAPEVGDYAGGDSHPYGVNLFAALYAFALHEAGGALDSGLLDPTHWGDQAIALEATGISGRTGNLVHCHPSFDEASSFGDALSRALAYVDAFIFIADGKLCVGWFPAQPVDASTLPEISEADLSEKPSGGLPNWSKGATSVTVVFKSFDKNYEDEVARYNAPTNRENTYAGAAVRADRPFIHAGDQAALITAEIAAAGDDEKSVNLTVLKSRAVDDAGAPLMPGALINFDYGPHSIDLVCRIIARRIRPGVSSDVLTIVRERGAFPRPYVAPIDVRVLPASDDPGEIDVNDVRLWFLPTALTDGTRQVTALVNRTKRSIYRFDLHMSPSGASPWEIVMDGRFFVAKCTVSTTALTGGAATVRVATSSVDFARMAEQSTVAQADDTLLALVGDELVSVGTIAAVSSGIYDLGILRGRRGTSAAAHAISDKVWLFYRSELQACSHLEFSNVRDGSGNYDAGIATKHFKIALFTSTGDGAAKPDDPGISLVLPTIRPGAPTAITYTAGNSASYGDAPSFNNNGIQLVCKVEFGPPSDGSAVVGYEWVGTSVDSDAAADAQVGAGFSGPVGPGYVSRPLITSRKVILSADILFPGAHNYFRVRSVAPDGIRSPWAGGGTDTIPLMTRPMAVGRVINTLAAGDDLRFARGAASAGTPIAGTGRYTVFDFACPADGTSDCLAAINTALAAPNGSTLVLPAGFTFRISGPLVLTNRLRIEGYGAKLQPTTADGLRCLIQLQADGCIVEGLEIDARYVSAGMSLTGGACIQVEANNCSIRHCEIHHNSGNGLKQIGDIKGTEVLGNWFHHLFLGIYSDQNGVSQPTDSRIIGNRFTSGLSSTTTAFSGAIKMKGIGTGNASAGHVIAGNIIRSTGQMGIELQQEVNGCTIANNPDIYGCGFAISVSGCTRAAVTGNVIKGCDQYGIEITSGSAHCNVTGNVVDGTDSSGTSVMSQEGISCTGSCAQIDIIGNRVVRPSGDGIHVYGADRIRILNNYVVCNASDLFLQNSSHLEIMGNVFDGACNWHVFLDLSGASITDINISNNTFLNPAAQDNIIVYDGGTANTITRFTFKNNIGTDATFGNLSFNWSISTGQRFVTIVRDNITTPGGGYADFPNYTSADITVAVLPDPIAGHYYQKQFDFTFVSCGGSNSWYKIFHKNMGLVLMVRLHIKAYIDGKQDEFTVDIGGGPYGQDAFVVFSPNANFNGGCIASIIYDNYNYDDGHEIWLRFNNLGSADTVHVWASDYPGDWITSPAQVTSAPSFGNHQETARTFH